MEITIQALDFDLTTALDEHIKRCLHFGLVSRREHIQRIHVRLSDINGPRGGKDKRCTIQLTLPGKMHVFVNDVKTDLYAAIGHATERTGLALERKIKRRYRKSRFRQMLKRIPDNAPVQNLSMI